MHEMKRREEPSLTATGITRSRKYLARANTSSRETTLRSGPAQLYWSWHDVIAKSTRAEETAPGLGERIVIVFVQFECPIHNPTASNSRLRTLMAEDAEIIVYAPHPRAPCRLNAFANPVDIFVTLRIKGQSDAPVGAH